MSDDGLSVLMPVHGGARPDHLVVALDSILTQTRPADELVLVADGPLTEELDDVIVSRSVGLVPLRRVSLHRRSGIATALQEGLRTARHRWVARMDADDIALPDRLAIQRDHLAAHGLDVVGSAVIEFDPDNPEDDRMRTMPIEHSAILSVGRWVNPVNHPTVVMRRYLALAAGGYQPLQGLEDYDLWARMWVMGARFGNVATPLLLFRRDREMLRRRRSATSLRAEVLLQRRLVDYGLIGPPQALLNVSIRSGFRILPPRLMRLAHRSLFGAAAPSPASEGPAAPFEHPGSR